MSIKPENQVESQTSAADTELFARIRQGDEKAFRTLFDRFYQFLLTVAYGILRDTESAKDVVQEVFFQIWQKRETIELRSSLPAYLKRATINRSLNQANYRKRFDSDEQLAERVHPSADSQELMEASEMKEVINLAMQRLPEKCRLVFVLRRHEGLKVKEIAAQLKISPKTVENQLTKALKIMKAAVELHRKKQ